MSPKQEWQAVTATIYTADYIDPGGENRPFWRVTYSYRVGEDYYSGEFTDFATDSEVEYHKNDLLKIVYSSAHPDKSRVSGLTTHWQKANTPFLVGASIAAIVMLVYIILSHR